MEPKYIRQSDRPPAFTVAGHRIDRLGLQDAPMLQHLLGLCSDYYALVEGRPAGPNAAFEELADGLPNVCRMISSA
jgi:hypothetical protein